MKWYEIAKNRIAELGLSQEKVAEHIGVTKGAISHWFNGRREPTIQQIGAIFEYLGVKDVRLNADGTFYVGGYGDNKPVLQQYDYPLFAEVQAGSFGEVGTYTERDAKGWIATTRKASVLAFWLTVVGHSMTAPQGSQPSFPEGMLILIDPAEDVLQGDFCVAILNNQEVTFKQYQMYGGQPQLEPLNPRYDIIKINEGCRIIGKVIKAQWPEDTF
ncbi:LexA family protein [Serratia entomophila]|uniref:LexA family protein n=1 Tax=Serratia entomophila TaxID=42906 RepID=UPI00217963DC|nr:S24 family peptidase [Serratia entomophila]CAI1949023.1 LexA repressor [Serratia entomophila]CAI2002016.1 LexA repressor [Serratia entomophila]